MEFTVQQALVGQAAVIMVWFFYLVGVRIWGARPDKAD